MKTFKYILVLIPALILGACSTTNSGPIDFIIPTKVPIGMQEVLDHDLPNYKGITTLGILKGAKQEMIFKAKLDAFMFNMAMEQADFFIEAGDKAATNVLGVLAAAGLGAGPIGFLAGARKKRPGDLTPEEAEAKFKKDTPEPTPESRG